MVTTGQEPVIDGFPASPHFIQIPHLRRKARALMKRSCRTILNKAQSWRGVVFHGAPVNLPGTKVPVVACLRRLQSTVARVRPRPAIALCCMPSWASASTSCLIPIEALFEQSVRIEKKKAIVDSNLPQCEGRFGGITTWAAVLDFYHHTWHRNESSVKVTSDFIGEQPQVHSMSFSGHWKHNKIDPYRFYCLGWGCNNLFARVYVVIINNNTRNGRIKWRSDKGDVDSLVNIEYPF